MTDWASAKLSDTARYARFIQAMLAEGVYLVPSQFEAAFISTVHDDEVVEATLAAARRALQRVAEST